MSLNGVNGARESLNFRIVTTDGRELLKGLQSDYFRLGAIYNIDGKCWTTGDTMQPPSSTDDRWTIIVKPES